MYHRTGRALRLEVSDESQYSVDDASDTVSHGF